MAMSDRETILRRLRSVPIEPVELPELYGEWLRFADRAEQFAAALDAVGGACRRVSDEAELAAAVRRLSDELGVRRARCAIEGLLAGGDAASVERPQDLADLDLAVAAGGIGVAENAAVWVTAPAVDDRAALFLAEHVALVLDTSALVDTMHQAYQRIDVAGGCFGVFVSGPSKTADIEQSLVIGAHGPRSLTVFLAG
jgi:L-lactate dehydrogenase complex protein LldG